MAAHAAVLARAAGIRIRARLLTPQGDRTWGFPFLIHFYPNQRMSNVTMRLRTRQVTT